MNYRNSWFLFSVETFEHNQLYPGIDYTYFSADAMGAEWRSVDDVCENSDYIIVTAHLSEETHHLINRARIDSMKPSAMLINVARGGGSSTFRGEKLY